MILYYKVINKITEQFVLNVGLRSRKLKMLITEMIKPISKNLHKISKFYQTIIKLKPSEIKFK